MTGRRQDGGGRMSDARPPAPGRADLDAERALADALPAAAEGGRAASRRCSRALLAFLDQRPRRAADHGQHPRHAEDLPGRSSAAPASTGSSRSAATDRPALLDAHVWFPWNTDDFTSAAAANLQQTLILWTTLVLTGLAVAFAFRCGLFNIGGQGQYFAGSIAAVCRDRAPARRRPAQRAARSSSRSSRRCSRARPRRASPASSRARSARTR